MDNMEALISTNPQELWSKWELRIIMIVSMCLQIYLVVFAPRRKTTDSKWFPSLISIAQSGGDWLAAYGLGLISRGQVEKSSEAVATECLSFWASFLLLHLGGCDVIISGSVEDKYLWVKQLVGLVAHASAILFIFFKSFPNNIWLPTALVFVAGLFRNAQRVISSLQRRVDGKLKDSGRQKLPRAHKSTEISVEMVKANIPTYRFTPLLYKAEMSIDRFFLPRKATSSLCDLSSVLLEEPEDGEGNVFWLMQCIINLYESFKCFITNPTFSSNDLLSSREFFRNRSAFQAFQKHEWHKFDILLTYVLLTAALALEIICLVQVSKSGLGFLWLRYRTFRRRKDPTYRFPSDLLTREQRWSESVYHINLLAWCLGYHSKLAEFVDKLVGFFCGDDIRNIVGLNLSVSVQQLTQDVKEIIFQEIRTKSAVATNQETAMKICTQRGDWALMRSFRYNELHWSLGELEYGESLVLWHIATQLCYNGSELERIDDVTVEGLITFCKILSDYMLYLLVLKPDMMASVTEDWKTVFGDTCAHVRGFFLRESVTNLGEAYKHIMSRYSHMPRRTPIFSEHRKSVLVDASVLAKQLQSLEGRNQWKLMSQVWVELLTYAAFRCEADIHAQQTTQGGELLTFVWLLINHLGFGKQVLQEDAPIKESSVEENVQQETPFAETSSAPSTAELNGVKYTNQSDLELAIPLEFVCCIQPDQVIPIQKIYDVLMPSFLHYLSKGNSNFGMNISNVATSSSSSDQNETAKMYAIFSKIQREIEAAKEHFEKLKQWEKTLDDHIKKLLVHDWDWKHKLTHRAADDAVDLSAHGSQLYKKLCQIDATVTSLTRHIEKPSNALPIKGDLGDQNSFPNFSSPEEGSSDQSSNARFSEIVPIGDFQACYDNLSHDLQKCLLYFSVFPANSKIRKKALTYLWIGEGFIDPITINELSSEEIAATYFQELVAKGLIEPVNEKDSGDFSICKMNHSIYSAVVRVASDTGFCNFDGRGKPTTNYARSGRACLSRTKDGSLKRLVKDVDESNADKLYTLFNLDENLLKFPVGWLSMMENLTTLCLGSWQSSDMTFFMVENTEFLQELCNLKLLKCLSLNRIYKIRKLPSSICKLVNLKILDLKACYDLQELPNEIGSLENLTHLDMSECHLIDYMPKGLCKLEKLLVLKGFVISGGSTAEDQCSLEDLAQLQKLRKLSIYTNRNITGNEGQFNCLFHFKALEVLTISWTQAPSPAPLHKILSWRIFNGMRRDQAFEVLNPNCLPPSLQKLDLRFWPLQAMPLWVKPFELCKLKKLYIRGGSLHDLIPETHFFRWKVKILRLENLKQLQIDRIRYYGVFPDLIYIHVTDCPKLFSPKLVAFSDYENWGSENKFLNWFVSLYSTF